MAKRNFDNVGGANRGASSSATVAVAENMAVSTKAKFDYNTLKDYSTEELTSLKKMEKELIKQGDTLSKATLLVGKGLVEARNVFQKHDGEESFMAWYGAMGLNKDNVRAYIGRYEFSLSIAGNAHKEQVLLGLSDRAIFEMIKKTETEEEKKVAKIVIEEVLEGKISGSGAQIRKEREKLLKEMQKKYGEAEEVEVVDNDSPEVKKLKAERKIISDKLQENELKEDLLKERMAKIKKDLKKITEEMAKEQSQLLKMDAEILRLQEVNVKFAEDAEEVEVKEETVPAK